MAYRIWSEQRQLFDQDCDDDGESAAGGRLLHLLQIMNVGRWCMAEAHAPLQLRTPDHNSDALPIELLRASNGGGCTAH